MHEILTVSRECSHDFNHDDHDKNTPKDEVIIPGVIVGRGDVAGKGEAYAQYQIAISSPRFTISRCGASGAVPPRRSSWGSPAISLSTRSSAAQDRKDVHESTLK